MKILTDSPKFANYFLTSDYKFEKCNDCSDFSLFFNGLCYIIEIPFNLYEGFDVMVLNEFSEQSQFDVLNNTDNISQNILCFSDSGNNFHGFKNRSWETLPGNFHLSLKIAPNTSFEYIYQAITIIAANSVIRTIKNLTRLSPGIKWVNDIMIDNSKVAGIITKTKTQNNVISDAIIGIGVNIAQSPKLPPDKFVKKTIHLNKLGYSISPLEFLNEFVNNLKFFWKFLQNKNYNYLFEYYESHSIIKNKSIKLFEDNDYSNLICEGVVQKINKDLSLKISGMKDDISKGRIASDIFL